MSTICWTRQGPITDSLDSTTFAKSRPLREAAPFYRDEGWSVRTLQHKVSPYLCPSASLCHASQKSWLVKIRMPCVTRNRWTPKYDLWCPVRSTVQPSDVLLVLLRLLSAEAPKEIHSESRHPAAPPCERLTLPPGHVAADHSSIG